METIDMEGTIAFVRADLSAARPEVWAGAQVAPEDI